MHAGAKVWKEIEAGGEWIVDADLKDFFRTADHGRLLTLVSQRVSDGRVLRLIEAMLKSGSYGEGRLLPTERGTPQGSGISPLLSNILLTPFDREMRRRGYQLTRYSDDWVVTCSSAAQARAALKAASAVLKALGVNINPRKTRIVHVRRGFEFLGYKMTHWPLAAQHDRLCRMLKGHYGYFGITGNFRRLLVLHHEVKRLWRRWLSRRSSKSYLAWGRFERVLQRFALPLPRIVHRYAVV